MNDVAHRRFPLGRRSLLWLLAGLWLLAPVSAQAQTTMYYSVGTAGDLKYGTGLTLDISGSIATFSSPQLNSVGVGDKVTYSGGTFAYIVGRLSSTQYTLATPTGQITVPGVSGQTVDSITRAFPTLTLAIAGAGNASHLNNFNLTAAGGNFVLHLAMYNDGPMNDGAININGYTTDATHYIRIFAPVAAGHVGSSQRHEGRAGTGFRLRPINPAPPAFYEIIQITSDHVRIEGIELDGSRAIGNRDVQAIRISASASADIRIDKVIIHDISNQVSGAAAGDLSCIMFGAAPVRLSNSICYAVHNNNSFTSTDIYGLRVSASSATLYLHNNTVYDIASLVDGPSNVHGISKPSSGPTVIVSNTAVLNVTRTGTSAAISCFDNSYDASSVNNVVSCAAAPGGATSRLNQTAYATYFRSVVAGAEDLHLLKDSITLWGANGADLTASALPVPDDVDGETRQATAPDIGADEFSSAPSPKMKVKSGKYQGTGSAKFVYVGFQPDAVFVKRLEGPYGTTAYNAVLKTNTMGGNTKSLWRGGIALASEPDMVLSLDPTGFTVGTDVAVNEGPGPCPSGCSYYWVAFKGAPGYMTVGSYGGDNATLRSMAVGFEPDYVIVLPDAAGDPAGTPVWASSTFAVGESYEFDARLRSPGAITGLESNGFQVGRGSGGAYPAPDLNASGTTYHYVAWNAVPGHTAVGTYLGNGVDRTLNVAGFYPAWVVIKKDDDPVDYAGERAVTHKTPATRNDESVGGLRFSEILPLTNTIQKLLPLGFEVGSDERVNSAVDATCRGGAPCTYHWVAFGPHEPQINYRSIGTRTDLSGGGGDGINVTAGSTIVTKSSGVDWLADKRGRGDRLTVGANDYQILGVNSANQLILASPAVANYSSNPYTIARQFDTLQEWENCISFGRDDGVDLGPSCPFFPVSSVSLVDDDRSEVGIAYEDSVFGAGVRFNGTTATDNTDATHTITLTADRGNRHYGLPGTGVKIDNTGETNHAIQIWDDYVTVEWMEIERLDAGNNWGIEVGGAGDRISSGSGVTGASRVVLRNNLIHVTGFGIALTDADVVADIYNNIMYDCASGIRISEGTSLLPWTQIRILNNTIYNHTGGGINSSVPVAGRPQQITVINNIVVDEVASAAGYSMFTPVNGASCRNLSAYDSGGPDNSAIAVSPCGVHRAGVDLTDDVDFVNAAGRNLHIQSTSTAVDAGANLSSLFQLDIDDGIRPATWDIGADESGTTEVTLSSFAALPGDRSVTLEWRTASELRNLGFHLYRGASENGPWTRLTSSLIPGLGSSPVGQAYSFRDSGLSNGTRYFYRLEDVDASSKTTSHGPVSAVPSAGAGKGSEPSGGDKNDKKKASASSCPDWVLSAYASAVGSDAAIASLRCTRHGDPEAVSLETLSRDSRQATLELRTGGFYALHEPAGTVRVFVPGFDFPQDEKAAALPIRRVLTDAVVGRRVQLGGVRALDLVSFKSLVPSSLGKAEMQVGWDGTVRAARRGTRTQARQFPRSELVSVLPSLFQGEQKSAVVEIAPLRFDAQRQQLVLAKRVRVRLVFTGREVGESGRGSVGRAQGPKQAAVAGEILGRLYTTSRGLHSVSFEQLFPGQSRGLGGSQLRLERQGEAVGLHLEPSADSFGPGSRLYFYADKAAGSTEFSGEVAYELVRSAGGVTMPLQSVAPGSNALLSASLVSRQFETNRLYQPGLLDAVDPWLWEPLVSGVTRVKSFTLTGVSGSGEAELEVYVQGASESGQPVDHHLSVSLNGTLVGEAQFAGKKPYRVSLSLPGSLLREGSNELSLTNVGDTGVTSLVFFDRFTLAHPQTSSLTSGLFEGTWAESGSATVSGVTGPAALVDVTASPRWLTGYQASAGGLSFQAAAGRRYLVASREALLAPRVAAREASTLRATTNQADYILVTPKAFLLAAEPLVQRRADQGLTTRVVTLEEIASEFGHGQPSAEAIKGFLAHAYHSWTRPSPRYVLLLGDASYDPRNFIGNSQPSPLPALWTRTSYLWTASDPQLAAVNGDDSLPDLAIGRLPAATVEQAEALVAKLLAWEDSGQGLAGPAVLVADNPDIAGDFEADVQDVATSFLAGRHQLLLLSELGAQTRPAILDALNSGLSYLSYVGHGGAAVWASENVWNSWDAPSLQAQSQQPLLVTMNCLNGYFVAPSHESLAESLMKAEGRGAIASFSPSGLSLDGPAHQYHRALMAELTSGAHATLGDAILAAQKTYAGTGLMPELLGVYHLLGDPALTIR